MYATYLTVAVPLLTARPGKAARCRTGRTPSCGGCSSSSSAVGVEEEREGGTWALRGKGRVPYSECLGLHTHTHKHHKDWAASERTNERECEVRSTRQGAK